MIQINDIDELEWHVVENDTPLKCNWCSAGVGKGGYIASIRITDNSEFSFVVCGEECLHLFKGHPGIIRYINNTIANVDIINKVKGL